MPITDYVRKKNVMDIVNSVNTTSNATCYIALSSTEPQRDGTGVTEPIASGNGYERIPTRYNMMSGTQQYVSNFPSEPSYDALNDKYSVTNDKDIYFTEAKASWGTLGYFAIYDAKTGGNMYAYGTLTNAIAPTSGTIPVIRAGDLTITEQ